VPGFVDPHGHVFNTGIQAISANLLPRPDGTVNDIAEMQAAFKAWAAQTRRSRRSTGGSSASATTMPSSRSSGIHRDDLDQVSRELPVVIVHQSGHLGAMNSKALELVGINADTKDRRAA